MSAVIDDVIKSAAKKMDGAIEFAREDFATIRTGRAHPAMFSKLMADYYGVTTPLQQLCSFHAQDARTMLITPYDRGALKAVERAIRDSDLGLNPATNGDVIRVPMPALTEERRKDLTKVVRSEAEGARVSVRNVRRDANNDLKSLLKDKQISEDEDRRGQDEVQKLTDKYIVEIDKLLAEKEKDLMSM